MPIVGDAAKVLASMKTQYGPDKGERVFYATANKQGRKAETWDKKSADTQLLQRLISSMELRKASKGIFRRGAATGAAVGLPVGAVAGAAASHHSKAAGATLPAPPIRDQLAAHLALLQHHIDDAEIAVAKGQPDQAQHALDDAEGNLDNATSGIPDARRLLDPVAAEGKQREAAAGVPGVSAGDEAEKRANDAFELGLRSHFKRAGFDDARIGALVDISRGMALGTVKTAADIHTIIVPHLADFRKGTK